MTEYIHYTRAHPETGEHVTYEITLTDGTIDELNKRADEAGVDPVEVFTDFAEHETRILDEVQSLVSYLERLE